MPRFARGEWFGPHNRPRDAAAGAAGRFRFSPGDRFDRHHHEGDEFWFVTEGRGRVRFGDETMEVVAGDILLAPAGTPHDVLAVDEVLAGFFAELAGGPGAAAGHLHDPEEDAAGHPIAEMEEDRG